MVPCSDSERAFLDLVLGIESDEQISVIQSFLIEIGLHKEFSTLKHQRLLERTLQGQKALDLIPRLPKQPEFLITYLTEQEFIFEKDTASADPSSALKKKPTQADALELVALVLEQEDPDVVLETKSLTNRLKHEFGIEIGNASSFIRQKLGKVFELTPGSNGSNHEFQFTKEGREKAIQTAQRLNGRGK